MCSVRSTLAIVVNMTDIELTDCPNRHKRLQNTYPSRCLLGVFDVAGVGFALFSSLDVESEDTDAKSSFKNQTKTSWIRRHQTTRNMFVLVSTWYSYALKIHYRHAASLSNVGWPDIINLGKRKKTQNKTPKTTLFADFLNANPGGGG